MTVAVYEIAPAIEPIKGTILDAADVSEGEVRGPESMVGQYPSYSCMKFEETPALCAANEKDLDSNAAWQDALWIGAYGGATCSTVGIGQLSLEGGQMFAEVEEAFRAGEHRAVERALMAHRFVENAAGSGLPGEWAAPADIAAAAVSPRVAVALLEGHAASNYNGVPTIHMPRVIAALLSQIGATEWDGNVLRTKMGSKIAAGGGYDLGNTGPDGSPAAANEKWLYATGEVKVRKGALLTKQAIETAQNDVFVLAERPYQATVDCYTAAIRTTVTV